MATPAGDSGTTGVSADQALDRLLPWFEALTPDSLGDIGAHYHPQARFKDPFNEVHGLAAVQAIFRHMFSTLEAPRFVIRSRVAQGQAAFVTWDFQFGLRGRALTIHGASRLDFDAAGRVSAHRDYWDAAEELYAKLPVLGLLMRALRRRLAVPG